MSLKEHVVGQRFKRKDYNEEEISEFLTRVLKDEQVRLYERVMYRIWDCGLNPREVLEGIRTGKPVEWEVTPEKWSVRIEVLPPHGDAAAYNIVVYINKEHEPFCEDIREATRQT